MAENISKEILLIDDSALAENLNLALSYAKKHRNISLLHQHRLNWAEGINRAFDIAQGEFITIIDSNDHINNSKYAELLNLAKQHNIDLVYGGREK